MCCIYNGMFCLLGHVAFFMGYFLLPLPTMANGDCITTNSKRIHVGWRIDVKWCRLRAIRCSNSLWLRHNYWLNDNRQCTWFRSSANTILHKLWAIKPISTVFVLFFKSFFFSVLLLFAGLIFVFLRWKFIFVLKYRCAAMAYWSSDN